MKPTSLTNASEFYAPVAVYCGLRDQILRLPAERAAASVSGTIGALMESGYPKAVATLVTLFDGTTSLCFSTGGGIIGAASISRWPKLPLNSCWLRRKARR